MNRQTRLESILQEKFDPTKLRVENVSRQHQGHAGDDGSGESHFSVMLSSKVFEGLGLLERQRMVHACCADEFRTGLHALELKLKAE